ncbi:MAG: hypothetical protein F7C32_00310 [Desulfurococcales archaeon]|nr:hypothetical protein [Desulfurococcales archaeon]
MSKPFTTEVHIILYKGLNTESAIAEHAIRDFTKMIYETYKLSIELTIIEVPEMEDGLPTVTINGEKIVEGRIPGFDELEEAVFNQLKEKTILGPAGFPLTPIPQSNSESIALFA